MKINFTSLQSIHQKLTTYKNRINIMSSGKANSVIKKENEFSLSIDIIYLLLPVGMRKIL